MALHSVDINEAIKETSLLNYCVCIGFDDKIYKFKITFEHMDVVNLIEEYINTLDRDFFVLKPEDSLNSNFLGKKFFPYMGKYRLKGKLKATDNYLEPPMTKTLEVLFSIYSNNIVKRSDFMYINGNAKFIKNFFDKANIELYDIYTLEEINTSLNLLDKLEAGIRLTDSYLVIKNLLTEAKNNNSKIKSLDVNDKFEEAIEKGIKKNKTYEKHN